MGNEQKYKPGFNVETGAFIFALSILTSAVVLTIPLCLLLALYDYVVVNFEDLEETLKAQSTNSMADWFYRKYVAMKILKKFFRDLKWIIGINTFLIGCILNMWPMIKYSALGCYGIAEKKPVHVIRFRTLAIVIWWEGLGVMFGFLTLVAVGLALPDFSFMTVSDILRFGLSLTAALVVYRVGLVRMVDATYAKIMKYLHGKVVEQAENTARLLASIRPLLPLDPEPEDKGAV